MDHEARDDERVGAFDRVRRLNRLGQNAGQGALDAPGEGAVVVGEQDLVEDGRVLGREDDELVE